MASRPRTIRCSGRRAFTLVEALVSIFILAGMILVLATVFRQSSRVTQTARGGARAFQAARQVFESIGRDLAGLTRDGFLFIRTQQLDLQAGPEPSGLILYYDDDGEPARLNGGRFDVLVASCAGYQTSGVDANRQASFARVIWAQTERASGNNLAEIATHPKYWAVHLVLARHQTLMLPDRHSCDASNGSYSGGNRGADFYNMALSDLTRYFGPAMGSGAANERPYSWRDWGSHPERYEYLPMSYDTFGLFTSYGGLTTGELAPFRLSSKVWRLGRDGPGPGGEAPGGEGGGDLTRSQVHSEASVPVNFMTGPGVVVQSQYKRHGCIRGHERPKVFGPADYHRIAALGVASFQVDWSDGRLVAEPAGGGSKAIGTTLQFYPESQVLVSYPHKLYPVEEPLMGPGEMYLYCWNSLSPASIRDTGVKKGFRTGIRYGTRYTSWDSHPADWREVNAYTQVMFSAGIREGAMGLNAGGWPWPKALRVRILLFDTTVDPPMGYQFEQVYHLLVQ